MQTNVPWRAVLRRNVDIPRQPCKAAMLISVIMYSDFSGCLLPAQRKSCLMLVTWQPSDWGTLGRDWNSPSSVPAGHQPLNSRHFCPLVPTFADVSMDNDLMFSAIAAKSWKRHVKLYIYVYIPRASNVWLFLFDQIFLVEPIIISHSQRPEISGRSCGLQRNNSAIDVLKLCSHPSRYASVPGLFFSARPSILPLMACETRVIYTMYVQPYACKIITLTECTMGHDENIYMLMCGYMLQDLQL